MIYGFYFGILKILLFGVIFLYIIFELFCCLRKYDCYYFVKLMINLVSIEFVNIIVMWCNDVWRVVCDKWFSLNFFGEVEYFLYVGEIF